MVNGVLVSDTGVSDATRTGAYAVNAQYGSLGTRKRAGDSPRLSMPGQPYQPLADRMQNAWALATMVADYRAFWDYYGA